MKNLNKLKEQHEQELLEKKNVQGVAIGEKETDGKLTGETAILVLVEKKRDPSSLSAQELVPKEIDGVKTDVIEVGKLRPMKGNAEASKRFRPMVGGCSAIHEKGTACTAASLVYRKGKRYLLQNVHCAIPHWKGAKEGDHIVQPSPNDGGRKPKDRIGEVSHHIPLVFDKPDANFCDSALVELDKKVEMLECEQLGIGKHSAKMIDPLVGMAVIKSGRTTGVQRSVVRAVNATVRVYYGDEEDELIGHFYDQVLFENANSYFCDGGDSSSLVLSVDGKNPVAQLYAGSDVIAIGTPIKTVAKALDFKFSEAQEEGETGYVALEKHGNVRPYAQIDPKTALAGNKGDLDYDMTFRAKPSTSGAKLGVLRAGTKFEIIEVSQAEGYTWARVKVIS